MVLYSGVNEGNLWLANGVAWLPLCARESPGPKSAFSCKRLAMELSTGCEGTGVDEGWNGRTKSLSILLPSLESLVGEVEVTTCGSYNLFVVKVGLSGAGEYVTAGAGADIAFTNICVLFAFVAFALGLCSSGQGPIGPCALGLCEAGL